jgi:SAM-dependent methyltransferase
VADQITGSILDAGCGTGENVLYFASRGNKVTGIDFLAEPINRAKKKARERGLSANFLVMDALSLQDLPEVCGNSDLQAESDTWATLSGWASVAHGGCITYATSPLPRLNLLIID